LKKYKKLYNGGMLDMGNCMYCGRPLADGEVCNCQAGAQPQMNQNYGAPQGQPVNQGYGAPQGQPVNQGYGAPQGQPMYQGYGAPQGQAPYVQPKQSNASFDINGALAGLVGLIKKPKDTTDKLMSEANMITGMLYIAVQALLTCMFVFITFGILGIRSYGESALLYGIYTFFFVAAVDFIVVAFLFLFLGIVFKGGISFSKATVAVGIFALYESAVTVAASIFTILGGLVDQHFLISFAFIIFAAGTLTAIIFGTAAVYNETSIGTNGKIYAIALAIAASVFCAVALDNIAGKCLNDTGVSAESTYYWMHSTQAIKDHDEYMRDMYDDYYDHEYNTYGKFLREYYD
jgi:hypothetical protein